MKLSKGIVLLFLGLFFKVAVAENSTQVYWLELEIESSVYDNITAHLREHTDINVYNAVVSNISLTTDCKFNGMQKNCKCEEKYSFSEDMCKHYYCCNDTCTLNVNDIAVCLPKTRVSINGSTIYNKTLDEICKVLFDPSKKNEDVYKKCEKNITDWLTETYSKLNYFDSLIINAYSPGSVIVDYTVIIMSSVTINDLEIIRASLPSSDLKTTGLVDIEVDKKVIEIGSSASVNCTPPVELRDINVTWYLTDRQNKTTQITKGKEATLTKNLAKDTDIVELKDISGSWKGTIKCVYIKGSIQHTASIVLDIALLPEIQITSTPQFPDCRDKNAKTIKTVIQCKILDDGENYNVTWNTALSDKDKLQENTRMFITYTYKTEIVCAYGKETENVECIFRNIRAQKNAFRSQNVSIPIINPNSEICDTDGVWPIAKSGYTAIKLCTDGSVGSTSRNCTNGKWLNEISSCVNAELHGVQQAVEELSKGIGFIKDDAGTLFKQVQQTTTVKTFQTFANINASVSIFEAMNNVSKQQKNQWNDSIMPDFVSSISNALNETDPWKNPLDENTHFSVRYLQTIEKMIYNSNLNSSYSFPNAKLVTCNKTGGADCGGFDVNVSSDDGVVVVAFQKLQDILPQYDQRDLSTTILSVTTVKNVHTTENKSSDVKMLFEFAEKRLKNHKMYCIFWDESKQRWSEEGCKWGGADNPKLCTCTHNSAFTIMMSKDAETLPYEKELTYVGLGISIVSLVLCLIIEFLVWDAVVRSDISNFRHVALVNICLCLLFAHCAFLATSEPKKLGQWCSILTVIKHFFFLAVFFWMLCLSIVLLHQMIFVFDQLRKKVFLVLSITVGYVCPLICVATTYIAFENGKEDEYFSKDTCWLTYQGLLKGSLFSFVIPALTIVIVNLFTLVVVILKIVTPTVSDSKARDQKDVARAMIKTIVTLSPVLGITWLLGILVLYLDLTQKPFAQIVYYSFTVLNSLQGFLILLTNCLKEKKVRDALLKRFKSKKSAQSKSETSGKATSSVAMTK